MVVRSGSTLTEGTFGQKVSLKTVNTYNTRYSLSLNCLQPDGLAGVNIIGEPEYIYDLSLVDNLTGQEVLTSSVNSPGLPPHIIMPKLKEAFR